MVTGEEPSAQGQTGERPTGQGGGTAKDRGRVGPWVPGRLSQGTDPTGPPREEAQANDTQAGRRGSGHQVAGGEFAGLPCGVGFQASGPGLCKNVALAQCHAHACNPSVSGS